MIEEEKLAKEVKSEKDDKGSLSEAYKSLEATAQANPGLAAKDDKGSLSEAYKSLESTAQANPELKEKVLKSLQGSSHEEIMAYEAHRLERVEGQNSENNDKNIKEKIGDLRDKLISLGYVKTKGDGNVEVYMPRKQAENLGSSDSKQIPVSKKGRER